MSIIAVIVDRKTDIPAVQSRGRNRPQVLFFLCTVYVLAIQLPSVNKLIELC